MSLFEVSTMAVQEKEGCDMYQVHCSALHEVHNLMFLSSIAFGRLEGKVAIITGGSSGIGAATARKFVENGAKVVIADINDNLGSELAKDIHATYIHCDVSDETQVKELVDRVVAEHGSLDIMFNNAGLVDGGISRKRISFAELDMLDVEKLFDTNLKGVLHGVKHAARIMIPNKSGSILSTASVGQQLAGMAFHPYTISKHAVVGITKSAACELCYHGIRVNCISPRLVDTPMATRFRKMIQSESKDENVVDNPHDLSRITLKPEVIANAVLFLASDEGGFISGQNLVVDGGLTLSGPDNIIKKVQMGLLKFSDDV